MGLAEKFDKATGLISEAENILNNLELRQKMMDESYLHEMQEIDCYKKALLLSEEALRIVTEYQPIKILQVEELIKKIKYKIEPPKPKPKPVERKIEKIIHPKIEKSVKEITPPVKKTFKKKKRSRY